MTTNIRTPEGVKWDCSACGACCRGYEFGPISPRIIAGLRELEIEKHWAPAAEQPWVTARPDGNGGELLYFNKVDDHCIFLQDDNLCAIHGRFGAEAKPSFCREFPFHTVQDPTGLVAIVRADCAGFHKRFDDAGSIEQGAAEAAALPRVIPQRVFNPLSIDVFAGFDVGLDEWLQWEGEIQSLLDAQVRPPEDGIALIRAELARRSARALPAADPERGRMAVRAVLQAMRMVMDKVLSTNQDGSAEQIAFAQMLSGWIDIARDRAEAGPPPPLDDRGREYLSILLRSFWMARQWQSAGSVSAGLGRWLFHSTVCRYLADEQPVTPAAWSQKYTKWNRFSVNRTVEWVMDKATPAFVDVYRNGV